MEIVHVTQGHVASVACAKFVFLEACAQQHNSRPTDTCVTHVSSCEHNISLHQQATKISSAQCVKAPGLDGATNDMFKGAPQQVVRHLHPLLCKMSLGCEDPSHSRGAFPLTCTRAGVQIGHDLSQEHCLQQCAFKTPPQVPAIPSAVCGGHFLQDTQCGGTPNKGHGHGQFAVTFVSCKVV